MARDEEILFGKVAVKKGFISKEELKEALAYQEKLDEDLAIGEVMRREDFLTEDQLETVLEIQKKNLEKKDDLTDKKKKDILFGKLVLKKGYMDWDELNPMIKKLNELRSGGRYMRLGQLLIEEGYLTSEQVHEVLEEQNKQVMQCVGCGKKFNVATPPRGERELSCPNCDDDLRRVEEEEEPDVEESVAMEGEPPEPPDPEKEEIDPEDTTIMTEDMMKKEAEMKEAETKYLFECVICSNQFRGRPDELGRVECPNCTTIFSASEGIVEE